MKPASALALVLAFSACGADEPRPRADKDAKPAESGPLLGCDGYTFTPHDLAAPGADEAEDRAAGEARKHADAPGPLRELGERNGRVLFGVGTATLGMSDEYGLRGSRLATVEVAKDGDDYRFVRTGACILRPRLDDGSEWAAWAVAPTSPPAEGATELKVLVRETGCSGGQTAEGRIGEPRVEYGADAVAIGITARPLGGVQTCEGSPPTPFTVKLTEPLGNRRLLDGGHYPPIPPAECGGPFWCGAAD